MKRTDVTYGQLDKVLRSLGFSYRPAKHDSPGHVYEHKEAGAVIMLPAFAEDDTIFEYQLAAVRTELDNFGLADPSVFAAKLQKAGRRTTATLRRIALRRWNGARRFRLVCAIAIPIRVRRWTSSIRRWRTARSSARRAA